VYHDTGDTLNRILIIDISHVGVSEKIKIFCHSGTEWRIL